VLLPALAHAQARVEVELGGGLLGGAALGAGDANLVANSVARQDFRLFSTDTDIGRAPALPISGSCTRD
jgi:hypothetical protein